MATRYYDRELKCGCLISSDGGGGVIPCSYPEFSTNEEVKKCADAWLEWVGSEDWENHNHECWEKNQ